jgi:hypothetical protein
MSVKGPVKRLLSRLKGLIALVVVWGVALEAFGLLGIVVPSVLLGRTMPSSLFPHPAFRELSRPVFYAYHPNLGWYPQTYRFGAAREQLPAKEADEYRVFILGGSTVEGEGVGIEAQTIAKRREST